MKRRNWPYILLILLCLGSFYAYRTLDAIRTDTQPPEIRMDSQIPELSVQSEREALLQGITAEDDVDGDVTDSLVVERVTLLNPDGSVQVDYAAFDKAGNVTKAQREAQYTDYESPRFTMYGPLLYPYGASFDILSTVGARDALDGDIQHRVRATSMDDTSIGMPGTHYVQFQVSNSLGDTVSRIFPVEVYDPEQYDASLSLTDYLVYLPKDAQFQAKRYLKTYSFRGEDTSLTNGLPADFSLKVKGEVQTQYPGVYPVEYRVTYTTRVENRPDLDQEYVAYSKLIVVVEG